MIEDTNTEIDIFEDDYGLLVAEGQIRDIADELEELHYRRGSHFIWQLKVITSHPSFYPIKGEENIYTTGGETEYSSCLIPKVFVRQISSLSAREYIRCLT